MSIKDFYDGLSTPMKDLFVTVVNDLNFSASNDKIERLEDFQRQLKREIDEINRRRQALGVMASNVETLLARLEDYGDDDLEIVMLRNNFERIIADIKAEVAATKPERKLEKKFDVSRRKEALLQRQALSEALISTVIDGDSLEDPVEGLPEEMTDA